MAINAVINFATTIGPLIVAEGTKRGYKIFSTAIAQAIIESRYGESQLAAKYHNYFGLKAGKTWLNQGKPSVNMKTKEEYTVGKLTSINDYFRVYPDMKTGVTGYYDFISTSRYANLKTANTYKEYAEFLKADGYATSSSYVKTLCDTVDKYGLTIYDGEVPISKPSLWDIGKTYTTQQDLYIRNAPNGDHVDWNAITPDGQKHSFKDDDGYPILKKGTKVTIKEIKDVGSCIWVKIPSGWICGKNSKNIYIK